MNRRIVNFIFCIILVAILYLLGSNMTFKYGTNIDEIDSNIEWEFFHEQWINPQEAERYWGDGQPISFPHNFIEEFNTSETFGTYITKVVLPTELLNKELGVSILFEYGSYELYINNDLILNNGRLSSSPYGYKIEVGPKIEHFSTNNSEIYLTLQLSNFSSIRGGFAIPIQIGEYESMLANYYTSAICYFLIIGLILILGVFLLRITLLYKQSNSSFLILAFIYIAFAIRSTFARPFFYSITALNISWEWAVKIEAITTIIITILFIRLCHEIIRPFVSSVFFIFSYITIAVQASITLIMAPMIFQQTFIYFFLIHLYYIPYCIYVFIRNYKKITKYKKVQFSGILLLAVVAIHDVLVVYNFLNQPMLIHLAIVLHALLQLIIISEKYKENSKLASKDTLTGLSNRHVFNTSLKYYFEKTREPNYSLTLLMIDLDCFKQYNDTYGHQAGDELLINVVNTIKEVLPLSTVFTRYGGEEFAILIDEATIDIASLCHKLVKCVEDKKLEHKYCQNGFATISLGGYQIFYGHNFKNPNELIIAADSQLYKAKELGKNRYQFSTNSENVK